MPPSHSLPPVEAEKNKSLCLPIPRIKQVRSKQYERCSFCGACVAFGPAPLFKRFQTGTASSGASRRVRPPRPNFWHKIAKHLHQKLRKIKDPHLQGAWKTPQIFSHFLCQFKATTKPSLSAPTSPPLGSFSRFGVQPHRGIAQQAEVRGRSLGLPGMVLSKPAKQFQKTKTRSSSF